MSGGGILYNSPSHDISNPSPFTLANSDIREEKIPTIVEQLNYQEIKPPKIDTQKEMHQSSLIEKEVAILTTEADLFIEENHLALASEANSEKEKLETQEQIATVLSTLDSLENQLDTYTQR